MINIVLYQPEIPPNTGNIIRLCANCNAQLHLIEPLGFELSDKRLRRAGLDYHEFANISRYRDYTDFMQQHPAERKFALTTKARQSYTEIHFAAGDYLLFGPETRGLPENILADPTLNGCLRIPMRAASRSLNLSNSVAIICYEACRQLQFAGLE